MLHPQYDHLTCGYEQKAAILYKTKVVKSRDYQKLLLQIIEPPFQEKDNISLSKYDRFSTSLPVDYLGYVFPQILHNYF